MGLIAAGIEAQVIDRPGGIFVRRGDQISEEDRLLMQAGGARRSFRISAARWPSRSRAQPCGSARCRAA